MGNYGNVCLELCCGTENATLCSVFVASYFLFNF